jgi:hypothetical protein
VEDGLEEGLVGMLHSSRELSPDEFCSAAWIDRWLQSVHTCSLMLDTAQPLADFYYLLVVSNIKKEVVLFIYPTPSFR